MFWTISQNALQSYVFIRKSVARWKLKLILLTIYESLLIDSVMSWWFINKVSWKIYDTRSIHHEHIVCIIHKKQKTGDMRHKSSDGAAQRLSTIRPVSFFRWDFSRSTPSGDISADGHSLATLCRGGRGVFRPVTVRSLDWWNRRFSSFESKT